MHDAEENDSSHLMIFLLRYFFYFGFPIFVFAALCGFCICLFMAISSFEILEPADFASGIRLLATRLLIMSFYLLCASILFNGTVDYVQSQLPLKLRQLCEEIIKYSSRSCSQLAVLKLIELNYGYKRVLSWLYSHTFPIRLSLGFLNQTYIARYFTKRSLIYIILRIFFNKYNFFSLIYLVINCKIPEQIIYMINKFSLILRQLLASLKIQSIFFILTNSYGFIAILTPIIIAILLIVFRLSHFYQRYTDRRSVGQNDKEARDRMIKLHYEILEQIKTLIYPVSKNITSSYEIRIKLKNISFKQAFTKDAQSSDHFKEFKDISNTDKLSELFQNLTSKEYKRFSYLFVSRSYALSEFFLQYIDSNDSSRSTKKAYLQQIFFQKSFLEAEYTRADNKDQVLTNLFSDENLFDSLHYFFYLYKYTRALDRYFTSSTTDKLITEITSEHIRS